MQKITKKENGITLIVLVVTIILLLILAGITISQLTGNGIFEKAKSAKNIYENKQEEENRILENYIEQIEKINSGRDVPFSSGKFLNRYRTSNTVKNNKKASITMNNLDEPSTTE